VAVHLVNHLLQPTIGSIVQTRRRQFHGLGVRV
jgi:hypothetical protein